MDRHTLDAEIRKALAQPVAGYRKAAQIEVDCSPVGVVNCAGFACPNGIEEHWDNASTICSDQDTVDDVSAVGFPEESVALGLTPRDDKKDASPRPEIHTASQVSCDVRPNFVQRSDGSFTMKLPSINVEVNTTCFATEPLPSETDFQAHINDCVAFPEAQFVVFDPVTRTPAGMCMVASVHKCIKVFDAPFSYDLIAKLNAHSTKGTQTLEERLYTNGSETMPADVHLNYEVRVNGSVSTFKNQLVLEVDFTFQCSLNDSAMGFLHAGQWWGLKAARPVEEVPNKPQSAEFELSYIEHRVGEIHDTLLSTDSGSMSSSCWSALRDELALLQKNAELCEAPLLHSASPDDSPDGIQVAESVQRKRTLQRFLKLYRSFENAHYKAADLQQVE
jgi:hypothetical protein